MRSVNIPLNLPTPFLILSLSRNAKGKTLLRIFPLFIFFNNNTNIFLGVFAADEITAAYVAKRSSAKHKNNPIYFRADIDAQYEATYQIPLDEVFFLLPSPTFLLLITRVIY
jgi:hypothetical protein